MGAEDKVYKKRRKMVGTLSIVVFILVFAGITIAIGKPLLQFMAEPEKFREWVAAHGIWGKLAFIGIQALQVVFAVIPGEPMEIGAGYAFGALWGLVLCLIGVAVGTAVIYGFVRLFGVKLVEAFISREKIDSLKFIHNSRKLNLLVFILFFIPGTPKDVLTYFIGLTPMKLSTFLLISSIARIPSIITSTTGGDALGVQNYTMAIVVFVVTGVISGIGLLVYNRIARRKEQE